ncbi:MAG: asparaginase [Alphaproteobacteria bacterium]|nr:asparaginase [Alphaproteobacteria bacterium]MBV9693232.1 asparaginase [Alphaproteobacteria bacterium]
MPNPVLVEVTRGSLVESVHRGSVAVADAGGKIVFALGDLETPVYPRSSLKPIQALPLIESGAADAFGLGPEEIALACASHSGEPMHTSRVAAWLARIGCGPSDLACGAHPSRYEPVAEAMIRNGETPTRIFNNCSGKHTGFLSMARHWDIATAGYERHDHPVQKAVLRTLTDLAEVGGDIPWGIDGCAAPNFALPLAVQAHAFAKLAGPRGARIFAAMVAHPELVSGTGRTCAILMRSTQGRAAVKTGAEGFFAGFVPELRLGIALKIDDGAARAAETAMAAVLAKLGLLGDDEPAAAILRAPIKNTVGATVGERRAVAPLI